jgi:hypothetical protein
MAPNLLLYQLLLVTLVLICLLTHVWWPDDSRATPQRPLKPDKPRCTRSTEPKPFPGFLHKPLCQACEQGTDERPKAPSSPPPLLTSTRGRRRTVDTRSHFCADRGLRTKRAKFQMRAVRPDIEQVLREKKPFILR